MGTKCAPPYSCIFMGKFENNYILPLSELIRFWKRFIDDIFFIFLGSLSELNALMNAMNNLHPTIKFNFKFSQTKVEFLDTTIHIDSKGKLYSTLYTKPTDTMALLHFDSFHPSQTKSSIIYSQAIRYRMLITCDDTLKEELKKLRTHLIFRGYPRKLIEKEFRKISAYSQQDVLKKCRVPRQTDNHSENQSTNRRLVFTVPYTRHIPQLGNILHKHWHYISADSELSNIWDKPPTIAIKRHKNLRDILVRSKT